MQVFDAIARRRAVKAFDPAHKMSQTEIDKLFEAVRLSPTSFNIQNWRFVLVQDPGQRQRIKDAAWGQAQISDASLVVVICGDVKAWQKNPERYWERAPKATQDVLVPMLVNFYESRGEQTQRDEVMRSAGIAAQSLMLAAQEMGYDSCPMIGFDPAAVADTIKLPKDHEIAMIVALGKKTADAHPRGGALPANDVIFYDRFPG